MERAEGAVRAANFKWREEASYTYTFVLRNLGDEHVKDVTYVVIFYGKDGLPVHSELGIYKSPIMGHLAKIVGNGVNGGAPYVSDDVRKQSNKVEIRVLNYQVIR